MPVHSLFLVLLIPIMVGLFIKVCSEAEHHAAPPTGEETPPPAANTEEETTTVNADDAPSIRTSRVIPKYKRRALYGDFPSPPPYSHIGEKDSDPLIYDKENVANWICQETTLRKLSRESSNGAPPAYSELMNTV